MTGKAGFAPTIAVVTAVGSRVVRVLFSATTLTDATASALLRHFTFMSRRHYSLTSCMSVVVLPSSVWAGLSSSAHLSGWPTATLSDSGVCVTPSVGFCVSPPSGCRAAKRGWSLPYSRSSLGDPLPDASERANAESAQPVGVCWANSSSPPQKHSSVHFSRE